jgi:hypothetical protein
MILETESGSRYEIDPLHRRVRRLAKAASSESVRPGDGEWRDYLAVIRLPSGCALIHWEDDPRGYARCTTTTPIVSQTEPD